MRENNEFGQMGWEQNVLLERPGGAFRSLTGLVCDAGRRQESGADKAVKGRSHWVL